MFVSVPVYQVVPVILILAVVPSSIIGTHEKERQCLSSSVFCLDMDADGDYWIGSNASQTFDPGPLIFSLTLHRSITLADVYSWTLRFNDSLQNFAASVSLQHASQKIELQVRKNNGSKISFSVCFENCMTEAEEVMGNFFLRRDKDDSNTNAIVLQSTPRVGKQLGLSQHQFVINVTISDSSGTHACTVQPPVYLVGRGMSQPKGRPPLTSAPMCLGLGILAVLIVASFIVTAFLTQSRRLRRLRSQRRRPLVVRSSNRLRTPSLQSGPQHRLLKSTSKESISASPEPASPQTSSVRRHSSHEKAPSRHTSRQNVPLPTGPYHAHDGSATSGHAGEQASPSQNGA